eukprot:comp12865_c0_seq1/m.8041 comp12865_c0_seq1/g.8041  ORF comp12865_c0_seq1/g.8041 comp12865_c0_seq1/m.8041 type:complete len:572 (-) comp12865_c0_seq1:108-1823(-)
MEENSALPTSQGLGKGIPSTLQDELMNGHKPARRRVSTSVLELTEHSHIRRRLSVDSASPSHHALRRVSSIESGAISFRYVTSKHVAQNLYANAPKRISKQLEKELEVGEQDRGPLYYTLHCLLSSTRMSEFCPLLVELTSVTVGKPVTATYNDVFLALLVNKAERDQSTLVVLQPAKAGEKKAKIQLIIPLWSDVQSELTGDGQLLLKSSDKRICFSLPSVRCLWTVSSTLDKARENAFKHNYYPGGPSHRWLNWYKQYKVETSEPVFLIQEPTSPLPTAHPTISPFLIITRNHSAPSQLWHSAPAKQQQQHIKSIPEELAIPKENDAGVQPMALHHVATSVNELSTAAKLPTEKELEKALRKVMSSMDLDNLTCAQVRRELERRFKQDLTPWKKFIDAKMMVVLGQMEASSEIFENFLYLGTEWNASNRDELDSRQINYILNMASEIDIFFPNLYQYCHVQIYDEPDVDLLSHLDLAVQFIEDAKNNDSRILVHCQMGVSRSASAVIAYGMKAYGWTVDQSLAFVKARRSCVQPNKGFMDQLRAYEVVLRQRASSSIKPFPEPITVSAS